MQDLFRFTVALCSSTERVIIDNTIIKYENGTLMVREAVGSGEYRSYRFYINEPYLTHVLERVRDRCVTASKNNRWVAVIKAAALLYPNDVVRCGDFIVCKVKDARVVLNISTCDMWVYAGTVDDAYTFVSDYMTLNVHEMILKAQCVYVLLDKFESTMNLYQAFPVNGDMSLYYMNTTWDIGKVSPNGVLDELLRDNKAVKYIYDNVETVGDTLWNAALTACDAGDLKDIAECNGKMLQVDSTMRMFNFGDMYFSYNLSSPNVDQSDTGILKHQLTRYFTDRPGCNVAEEVVRLCAMASLTGYEEKLSAILKDMGY